MRWRSLVGPALVVGLAGCAHAAAPLRLAQAPVVVCKHCNCYMPAPTAATADAPCTVCECHYTASHCVRGR